MNEDEERQIPDPCNRTEMVMSIVIGALGTVTKGLVSELENLEIRVQVETIQTTALLRSSEY